MHVLTSSCSDDGSGSVSWRSTRSSSVLSSSCEAEIYAGAMAAQELRWLTYLLTGLGEQPRSPPVLYVDNKAMLALCREHRLEHRTKHIALRYFLAHELQQRGQLRLAYVASEANTADIFTKALAPVRFALLDWSCDLLFSPTLPMGARWVVRGFDQTHGIDYTLTFAPVSRHTSVRLVLCEAASKNFPLRQIDVSNAFLYADVDAEIYVEYPHTYPTNPPSVCKLKKSLYGIKQAPRLWQQHLNKKLTEVGFRQLPHDPGMYRLDDKGSYALLVAYVDDILYVSSSTSLGDRIEAVLKKSLDLTISIKVTQFLVLNVSRTSSAIHLTASKYAESLAKRFNISTDFVATPYRSTLTGHAPNLKNLSTAGLQLYQQQLGCLLFAAVTCRPDLAYVASHLAQFLRCPKEEHSLDLQCALRYFVSTPTLGLIFNAGKPTDKMYLSGYVDADHAGDTKERSSSNDSPGTTPTPPPASGLQTEEGTATRPRVSSSENPANQGTGFDPSMMEKFFSFMSFYEQHQQGAPAQSNNSNNNNNVTPMSLDGSSYARGNQQQQPTFAPYEPQRGSVSFMQQPQLASGQERTLDALQVQSQFAHVLKLQTTKPFDGKDFFTWSFEFELMMEGAQILGFFDGSLPYPTNGTQYEKQQYTYQSMMAYTILLRNITPTQQQNIRSYRGYGNSAELAYNHLKSLYQATDSVSQSRLMAQLTTVEMKPGEKGMAYISRCRELRYKLLRCGGSISEDAFVTVIIGGLGPQWRATKAILRAHGRISEAALCAEIHAEQQDMDLQEDRHKRKTSAPEFASHTQRRYNNNNNRQQQQKLVPPFCHICKTSGHSHSTAQEFKLYHGRGGLYIGKAVLKNNVFVLDFVPDLGTADSDGIVTFTSWTHPPDLDPDFSPKGAETTSAAAGTPTTLTPPVASSSTASPHIDDIPPTPAQQLTPTPREVHGSANFTAAFYSNSDLYRRSPGHRASEDIWHARMRHPTQWGLHLGIEKNYNAWKIFDVHSKETVAARDVIFYERLTLPTYLAKLEENRDPTGGFRGDRHFASATDEAVWDEQNVDNASDEAGPLPYCSVPIPMDDENPRESINAETYFDFADTGYVTPAAVNTNEAERIGPNFIPDPEDGDEAAYPEDANLPRYTQSGLQILGLVTAVHGTDTP
ncbi:unnamed protein product [Closterium sp. NIES-53]